MRFAVLRLGVGVTFFYQMLVEDWYSVAMFQRDARSGGEFSLVMYLKSGGQTWGISATWHLPYAAYHAGVGQVPHKCIFNDTDRQGTRPSILAALGTEYGPWLSAIAALEYQDGYGRILTF